MCLSSIGNTQTHRIQDCGRGRGGEGRVAKIEEDKAEEEEGEEPGLYGGGGVSGT